MYVCISDLGVLLKFERLYIELHVIKYKGLFYI